MAQKKNKALRLQVRLSLPMVKLVDDFIRDNDYVDSRSDLFRLAIIHYLKLSKYRIPGEAVQKIRSFTAKEK